MVKKLRIWWGSLTGWKKITLAAVLAAVWASFLLCMVFVPALFQGVPMRVILEQLSIVMLKSIGLPIPGIYVMGGFFIWIWLNMFLRLLFAEGIIFLIQWAWRRVRRG